MEETAKHSNNSENNSQVYYIIGAVVIIAVIAAGFFLRPKPAAPVANTDTTQNVQVAAPTRSKAPITRLACESQYYNTVVGVTETYYLSVDGVAQTDVTKVDCNFDVTLNNKSIGGDTTTTTVNTAPERNGNTFRCSTKGLKLQKGVPVKVTVNMKDDQNTTATCNRLFLLP